MKARAVLTGGAQDGLEVSVDTRKLRDILEVPVPTPASPQLPGATLDAEKGFSVLKWKWDGGNKDSWGRYRFVREGG